MTENELEEKVKETLAREYNKGFLIGAQTVCTVILDKINTQLSKDGKFSFNDAKRLIKDVTNFCKTGVSRKVNADGTVSEPDSETVQN